MQYIVDPLKWWYHGEHTCLEHHLQIPHISKPASRQWDHSRVPEELGGFRGWLSMHWHVLERERGSIFQLLHASRWLTSSSLLRAHTMTASIGLIVMSSTSSESSPWKERQKENIVLEPQGKQATKSHTWRNQTYIIIFQIWIQFITWVVDVP